uniref:tRNA (adenine(37)-N6)-methyltransferase n=1 Tax=Knipowitschia caucasica TaxID=637954 RepID=A0AAV2J559_KNICA
MSHQCNTCQEKLLKLNQQVSVMRKEMKNLRQMLDSATRAHRKQLTSLQSVLTNIDRSELCKAQTPNITSASPVSALEQGVIQTAPIGYIRSCFSAKNGTPRQPTICGQARAELRIQNSVFNNPEHALVGLEQYSHVWVIFMFHKNGHLSAKAKVKPPRLNGQKVGVYSTRSPHRPNALGLTLAKLERIAGDTVYLSDIDMIDGTPVLDIKPYIPDWIREPPVSSLDVRFTAHAEKQLSEFVPSGCNDQDGPKFQFLRSTKEATAAIKAVLSADPRSVYRRERCTDKLFYFTLDAADVTCWFGQGFAEVLQIRPLHIQLK